MDQTDYVDVDWIVYVVSCSLGRLGQLTDQLKKLGSVLEYVPFPTID